MLEYSDNLKVNVNRLDSLESLKVLIEITHPLLSTAIRVVNDNCDMFSRGENYISFPFTFKRAGDIETELPKAQLVFSNIGRSMVRWFEDSYGANDAYLKIIFARRSEPDVWENVFPCKITSTSMTPENVTIELVILANKLIQRGIRFSFDTDKTPALF